MWCPFTGTPGSNPGLSAITGAYASGGPMLCRTTQPVRRTRICPRGWGILLACLPLLVGCRTERHLTVTSIPSGAFVRLDEALIGTTPLEHEFVHFGRRRLTLYYPGYRTWSEPIHLKAPWRARFPLDVLTEVLLPFGFRYHHTVNVDLIPATSQEDQLTSGEFNLELQKALERRREARQKQSLEPAVEPDGDDR